VSRIQSGNLNLNFSESNLSELVKEMITRFSDQLVKAKCSVELKIENNIKINMDVSKIEQVIDNLITNAIKYAPGKPIHIFLLQKNNFVELVIADEGPGIPIEKQTVIFDRFERANSSKAINGLGLGLYIVKEILKAHQGSVRLESEPGQGAKFIVEFPSKIKKDVAANSEKDHLHGV
jgi:signal transduction histidine kinase